MSLSFYIIDTETNGLSVNHHEINEISIIRCEDRVQLTEFIKCEKPENSSFDALKITNKTLADLQKGAPKEEIVEKVNDFFSKDNTSPAARCIIGHNVLSFDKKFLHALWEKTNQSFPAHLWLDTLGLTKAFIKTADMSKYNTVKTATGRIATNLHACCDMLGIKKISEAHASKVDSRNTYLLWKKLIDEGVDYLPHIKTFPHLVKDNMEELLATLEDVM